MNQIMDIEDFKRPEWKSVLAEMHSLMNIKRRAQWQSTFNQLFQARANEKGNIILYASQNPKIAEMQSLKQISKTLQKHHQLDFHKMLRKLEAA